MTPKELPGEGGVWWVVHEWVGVDGRELGCGFSAVGDRQNGFGAHAGRGVRAHLWIAVRRTSGWLLLRDGGSGSRSSLPVRRVPACAAVRRRQRFA